MEYPIDRFRAVLSATAAIILAVTATDLHAQGGSQGGFQYSISNEFRYGIGKRFEQEKTNRAEYLENLLNTRIYAGDLTLGFRLQVDKPREYGRDTIGIKEYYAEYRREGLRARAGTFYNLVGRGLVMNTFESRPIGFDTQTEGIRLEYEVPEFSAGAFGGIMDYADILDPKRVEQYLLRGASGEVRPVDEIAVGGSYLAASGQKTATGFVRPFDAYLREVYLRASSSGFRTILNFADKRTQLDSVSRSRTTSPRYGYGFYGSVGYSTSAFDITAELKDYRFDLLEPNEQQVGSRATRALPFQNPPNLIPQHDKTLLARNPHTPDYSDELGFQLEALFYPNEDLTVSLLAMAGSRHNGWTRSSLVDSSGESRTIFTRVNEQPLSFAELKDIRYSPYWEVYAHGEYQISEDFQFALGLQRKDNFDFALSENYKASTLMLETTNALSERDNLHSILELQRVFESKKIIAASDSLGVEAFDGKYFNTLVTLEYSRSPDWAVNSRIEFSTHKEEEDRQIWPVVGATYRIGRSHTVGLQYGSERGGLVCTGGVCRQILPFTGFRFTLVSRL